jgi:hypothetical protein
MSDNTDNRTATQRIEDLEKVVASIYQATSKLIAATEDLLKKSDDLVLVKEALKILNRKTEAIVLAATPESGITDSSVSGFLIQLNTSDLKAQTAAYVTNGQIAVTDTVAENSFLACEEVNKDGAVINPRIQFRMDSQPKETQDALTGKKVGDSVSFGDNKFGVNILEIYSLLNPPGSAAPAAETAPETAPASTEASTDSVPAAAPEAPAAETAPAEATA